ncbi:BTAD domain-containing putative transcriptional regulator [Saccharopolyspora elongata]|uniref:BTAD domain-containing putative transcriptional regulator n=1 Tax=Saccharopolyspora elongata TaxID=2530387 RepID=UPI001F1F2714|nr:BTAD domain-containing putative transcriptional regulator [Saccharopolyspora elongata]
MSVQVSASRVTFGVLGPLEAVGASGPVDLKGPLHRAVLARLLIARGRVVPLTRLIDDLWDDPPESAVGTVRTVVSSLRRALEPDRPPRSPARLLVTAAPGYALRAASGSVDAQRFEAAVGDSASMLAAGRADTALSTLDEVLALWRGPALAEFDDRAWARHEISRLDELRLLAVERRAQAALALGRAAEAVPDLEGQVAEHPWRETAWQLLALALYRSGRQGDALGVLREARKVLATELGVDPGRDLQRLEADILSQAPHLSAAPVPAEAPASADQPVEPPIVGRAAELAQLAAAGARGRLGLALISGEAGAGKTALAEALTDELAAAGWITAWGRSPEQDGAPAGWPWTEITTALAAAGHPPPVPPAAGEDPAAARFRMHRAAASYLSAVAERAPVLLVFDDLHRAGEETLSLLAFLATTPVDRRVLVVATYRSTEISAALTDALGRFAPAEPTRVYLGGLAETEVDELARAVTGRELDAATTRAIHRRSGGNPFFVRELTRLFDAEGSKALSGVPAGVRDVIRRRLAGLPQPARTVLRQAAVVGRDVDLDLLVPLAGDEDLVLDVVESALLMGFVAEPGPNRLRFTHELIRDTLYEEAPRLRRARWHAAIAETIEQLRPGEVESLAHHYFHADDRRTAGRAARYAKAAAEAAERRFAPHEAARLWRQAIAAHDHSGSGDARARLGLITGLVRALAVAGGLDEARRHRAEAIAAADELGDPDLTARVIGAFDVPAIWTRNDDEDVARQVIEATERTLAALPDGRAEARSQLLSTLALELRGTRAQRGHEAAAEAEAIARELDDPALIAFALNGRFMQCFQRAGLAPQRARIGAELVELAERHGLVTFEVLGRLILIQAHCALAEFAAADEHAAAADRLAQRHEIPLVGVFTEWYAALRLAVSGESAGAEAAYRAATIRLRGTGMRGVEQGALPLALLGLRLPDLSEVDWNADWGPYEDWVRPLGLLAAGHREQARDAARALPDSPRDLLYEARLCLEAVLAIGLADRPMMARVYELLQPAAGELAGAGSGLLVLGPVAQYLGDLAAALDRREAAGNHYRQAAAVARQAGAPHWIAAARARLT